MFRSVWAYCAAERIDEKALGSFNRVTISSNRTGLDLHIRYVISQASSTNIKWCINPQALLVDNGLHEQSTYFQALCRVSCCAFTMHPLVRQFRFIMLHLQKSVTELLIFLTNHPVSYKEIRFLNDRIVGCACTNENNKLIYTNLFNKCLQSGNRSKLNIV